MSRFRNVRVKISLMLTAVALLCVCMAGMLYVYAYDVEKPVITIDYGEYDADGIPCGLINSPYRVFGATVTDKKDSEPVLTTLVYKNYSIPDQRFKVTVTDGAFLPKTSGVYTIEYTAENAYGAIAVKTVQVKVLAAADPIEISAAEIVGAKQGYVFEIPTGTATGDSRLGNITVTAELWYGGKQEEITDHTHIPMYSGEYTVKYIARDYAGREISLAKTFNVEHNTELMVYDEIENRIPKYLVQDNKYELPELLVYEFGTDSYRVSPCEITVDGSPLTNGNYTANINENGKSIAIKYAYKSFERMFTATGVKARDHGVLDTKNLFVAYGGATVAFGNDAMQLSFSKDTDSVTYANPLSMSEFSFVFGIRDGKNQFKSVEVTVTDRDHADESISIRLQKTAIYVNGEKFVVPIDFNGDNTLNLVGNSLTVGGKTVLVNTYASGLIFEGFSSGFAYLTVSLDGVNGAAGMEVTILNGNYFFEDVDYSKPKIILSEEIYASYDLNEKFVLPSAIAVDVIDGNLDCKVSLTYDGEAVKDAFGNVLDGVSAASDYTVNLDRYGMYQYSYIARDLSGNRYEYSMFLTVFDDVKPEINVSNVPVSGRVNSEISLPEATATDNVTPSEKLQVYVTVIGPDAVYTHVTNRSFVPDRAGKWVVRYYVFDETGNLSYRDFTVEVKA